MSIPLLFLILISLGFLVFALCCNLLYWYETLNTPNERIPSPKAGFLPCLVHYCMSLGGYILCVALAPFDRLSRRKPDAPSEGVKPEKPPVILVHGLNNNASAWLYIGHFLSRAGYRVSTYTYASLFSSLDAILEGFEEHVRVVERFAQGKKPLLVGHSLGGLLIRLWLMRPENQDRAAGIVTLGTPHNGSKMAVFAPGRLGQSIRPDSSLILRLRGASALTDLPRVSLTSPADDAVLPASGLLPPESWRLRMLGRASHFGMLFCPHVKNALLEELEAMAADSGGARVSDDTLAKRGL